MGKIAKLRRVRTLGYGTREGMVLSCVPGVEGEYGLL